jgi:hypothetical protein
LRIAEETHKREIALHHAIQAQSTLHVAQELAGHALPKHTGMDTDKLEQSINDVIERLHKMPEAVKAPVIEPMKPAIKKGTRFGSPVFLD